MPSPFPGMNPYFEDHILWRDFHASLATEIRNQLAPQLRPKYFAALEVDTYYKVFSDSKITPAPLKGEMPDVNLRRFRRVEIRQVGSKNLVTAIEILSPVNKRPGHKVRGTYLGKRLDYLAGDVNLMEIDLLRGGARLPMLTPLPDAHYFILLSRAKNYPETEIWPLQVQDEIPILPIPLLDPDPDLPLDLGIAIHTIYDLASYDMRIDYTQPPPGPEWAAEDRAWLENRLQASIAPASVP